MFVQHNLILTMTLKGRYYFYPPYGDKNAELQKIFCSRQSKSC